MKNEKSFSNPISISLDKYKSKTNNKQFVNVYK